MISATTSRITRSSLRLLLARLARHKRELAIGLLGLLLVDLLQLIIPKLVQHAIDALARGAATMRTLLLVGAGMVAVSFGMVICRFVWRYFIVGASHKIERDLRGELYAHLQTLSPSFYDHTKVGDIMAHATNDIAAIRMATGIAALAAFDAAVLSVASLALMASMDATLTLLVLVPLPLLTAAVLVFGNLVHRRFTAVQEAFSRLSEKAHESFSGIRVIKAYGDAASEERTFSERAGACAAENIGLARVWSLFGPFIGALALGSLAILLGAGGRRVIYGTLSLGEFVAFSSYLGSLIWPMMAVGWVINLLQRGTASMDRIQGLLARQPDIAGGPVAARPEPAIAVKGLTFAYPGTETTVLSDVSFEIRAGATLGILGTTGSGKTTLVDLLLRLYDPPRGTVFVGGFDIHDMELAALRSLFGYVPQETFLFAMTIAENISFGADGMSRAAIEELSRAVDLDGEIGAFPEGLDTKVGERGVTLSGGQRQRVALARALAADPAILILDDAFSSVDSETEVAILARLRENRRGRTTIMVAHRVSTLRSADQIIVMDRGRIVARGTHEELMRQPGYYADLYHMQELEETARRAPAGADGAAPLGAGGRS